MESAYRLFGASRRGRMLSAPTVGLLLLVVIVALLQQTDYLPGENHRQQGIGNPAQGDVAQGEQKHDKVAGKINPLDFYLGYPGKAHGKGIVAAGGTAHPDAQAAAHAHKNTAHDGGKQGHPGNLGEQGRELLTDKIEQGVARCRRSGVGNKGLAEGAPAEKIA